ncbi:MAG: hypothetical protein HQK88_05085 [Nitrospirae bacterium]|nr:hypothetical protein [Nitrospirota bacterium]MBF0534019.1 hypothetical protein [Nitrospirota bacterium]MBF0616178.1 hypothetical protein [Nitrospirota bacterium]
MKFSERYNYTKVRDIVQIESMDEPLRNGLWYLLHVCFWSKVKGQYITYFGDQYSLSNPSNEKIYHLCFSLWSNYFKKDIDKLDDDWEKVRNYIKEYFFECKWFEVYDFIEFVASNYKGNKESFIALCNHLLEEEVSAYRFIDGIISRITEPQEIEAIELALNNTQDSVKTHLHRSLELLSNRENPDYRNSIKEAISAVESLAAITVGVEKGTLGQLIKKLEDKIELHPALKSAFSSLYGYTSDEGGIRHALMELPNVRFEDAKFFLVVCSAFINYIKAKVDANC